MTNTLLRYLCGHRASRSHRPIIFDAALRKAITARRRLLRRRRRIPVHVIDGAVHQARPLLTVSLFLKQLGLHVRPHDLDRAVLDADLSSVHFVFHKKEFGFDVLGFLGAGELTVCLQQLCADVVLE